MHDAGAGVGKQQDPATLSGLEPDRRASGDRQPAAARTFPIEGKRRVGLGEMIVRSHLDRSIPGIRDIDGKRLPIGIQDDLTVHDKELSRNHGALSSDDCGADGATGVMEWVDAR